MPPLQSCWVQMEVVIQIRHQYPVDRGVYSPRHHNSLVESTFQRRSVSATDKHIRQDALKSSRKILMEACGQPVEGATGKVHFSIATQPRFF
jgi:hypothetical protein